MNMLRNHLAEETSPYLLQHADNPVEWYPWGEAALTRAKQENKPILLSIGYSACHWCHVMAHESFEDPATAALMNELFVNIKVDREERPDLDKIYQVAQQMLDAWFRRLAPDHVSVAPCEVNRSLSSAARTFPRTLALGCRRLATCCAVWPSTIAARSAQIEAQSAQLQAALASLVAEPVPGVVLDETPLAQARAALEQSFDADFGGFTRAPKFPHPNSIERCMRHWYRTSSDTSPDLQALCISEA